MKRLFLLLSFFVSTLLPAEEEIVVRLTTEAQLLPVYLTPWTKSSNDNALSNTYLQELMGVLHFDLHHNGMTRVLPHSPECIAQQNHDRNNGYITAQRWQQLGALYLVNGSVQKKSVHITLYSIATQADLGGFTLALSGDLANDRRRIHMLADTMHEKLFGKPGIASTRILYTVRHQQAEGSYRSEVWLADYDGHNTQSITNDGNYCVTPTFLPPAPQAAAGSFFYVSYRTGQPKIYVGSIPEGNGKAFTSLRGNQLMPMVSPKRDLVAFVCDAGGNADLFIQTFSPDKGATGKPVQIYAPPHGTQASPSFNPSGTKIAFVSNKDGTPRIYTMDIPVENTPNPNVVPKLISRRNRGNTSPCWSPDGNKIAYSAMTNGTRQIWVYDFTTEKEFQLTSGYGHKENPSWASDSLHLVFNSATPEASELYITNLNQPKAIKISSGRGEKRFPSWEPRGLFTFATE